MLKRATSLISLLTILTLLCCLNGRAQVTSPTNVEVEFLAKIKSALIRSNQFHFEEAKRDSQEALNLAQAAKDDRLIALAYLICGSVAQQQVDNVSALKSYAAARTLLDRTPRSKIDNVTVPTLLPKPFTQRASLLQMVLHNIGLVYATQGDFDNAFDYFRQSLKYGPETGLCGLTSITYSTIGLCLNNGV